MDNLINIPVEQLRAYAPAASSAPVVEEAVKPRAARKAGRRQEYLPVVEWGWFCRMVAMPGKAGWVGLALYRLTVMRKKSTVKVCCRQLGVNRKAVGNAMKALKAEGIICTVRGRGGYATVTIGLPTWIRVLAN